MLGWWSNRPRLDWLAGIAAAIGWWLLRRYDMVGQIAPGEPDVRRAVYTQVGTVGTVVIGLFVVPVTLSLALAPQERLRRILAHRQGELRRAVMQAGAAAVSLVVFTIVAVAFDGTEVGNRLVRSLAPGFFTVALLSLIRVLYVLGALLKLGENLSRTSTADDIQAVEPPDLRRSA